jgi:hypothetical protein
MTNTNHEIAIEDGRAVPMGDGTFILLQQSDLGPQSVVLTADDLQRLVEMLGCGSN